MTLFEIVLIIIGILCIVVSCFLLENKKEETIQEDYGALTEQILLRKMQEASDKMDHRIAKRQEEIVTSADESLAKVSNEKIMAVHEYSDQILKEIDKNHQEVVFLYQMLTEKEKELAKTAKEILDAKREVEQFLREQKEDAQFVTEPMANVAYGMEESKETNLQAAGVVMKEQASREYQKAMDELVTEEYSNHIQEIIELANRGMSVVEISKHLGLGQGEVKLVLDFYKKA